MSTLSEKTKVPLGWVLTLMVSLLGLAATAGSAHYRLGALETKTAKQESRADNQDAGVVQLKQDVAVVRTQIELQTRLLQEMREELRRR